MKYLFILVIAAAFTVSCNNPDQNSAAGNSADVRDSSAGTNPNSNVDDSVSVSSGGHTHAEGDTSHHH
jgi:hypothetical protein